MKLAPVSIIAAVTAKGGVIGNNGIMPWKLKSDLVRFRKLTTPSAVVMGPKTYASIGKPLPNRLNIVLTTNREYIPAPGVRVAHDVRQARDMAATATEEHDKGYPEFFAIGGAAVYTSFMPIAEVLFITEVDADIKGDTHFPHWDKSEWHQVTQDPLWKQEDGDEYPTRFIEYHRLPKSTPPGRMSWRHPSEEQLGQVLPLRK